MKNPAGWIELEIIFDDGDDEDERGHSCQRRVRHRDDGRLESKVRNGRELMDTTTKGSSPRRSLAEGRKRSECISS